MLLKRNNKSQNKRAIFLQASEYRHFMALRLINIIIIGVFALAILGVSAYVYEKIYNTIGQVQNITVLRSNLGSEIIDFNALDDVEERWTQKHTISTTTIARDPFKSVVKTATSTP
jgi:hypothetical protein